MTKEQAIKKFEELVNDLDFKAWAMERAERMVSSNYINLEEFEDDFILPKAMMAAIGEEIRFQYRPLSYDAKGKRKADKLITTLWGEI